MSGRLRAALDARARAEGLALLGVTRPDASGHLSAYRDWLESGAHGDMGYLARPDAVARRADLTLTFANVRSVVVVADEYGYAGERGQLGDSSRGVIARYARGRDYHRVLRRKLLSLLRALDEAAPDGVDGRVYVDTGPVLERELAQRAGLGWFGRNTMLISPVRGSYFFLGVLLVDAEIEPDEPFTEDRCGSCRACLDGCPTGALLGRDERGAPVIDARRCIAYLTIEHRGPIPEELRSAIGNRIFGCDICQEVCPFTRKFSTEASEPAYAARSRGEPPFGVEPEPGSRASHPGTASPSLIGLLEMALDGAAWDSFSRGSAVRRAGRAGFARNVCVGLGNWGSTDAVPVLTAALSDSEPLVRAHAAWALGRIGDRPAVAALERLAGRDPDPGVVQEASRALGR